MNKNRNINIGILLAALLLTACNSNCMVEKSIDIPHATWHKDSVALLAVPISDTLSHCNILLTFRNAHNYPYNNIILAVTATTPSGAAVCDTVEYRLIDSNGHWAGKTGGMWIDHRLAFRTAQFPQSGDYTFGIAHLMRNEALTGVGAVGLRIEQQNN